MTSQEYQIYTSVEITSCQWYLPLQWIQRQVEDRLNEGKVSPPTATWCLGHLETIRRNNRKLYLYDWVGLPLVYTQVATLATYGYFALCLIGEQFLDPAKQIPNHTVDFYIPIFTIGQFLFYVGWFKVGQDLMRPFGNDDDDIELNYILDRNVRTGFALVNQVHSQTPPIVEDQFFRLKFGLSNNFSLPHTEHSRKYPDRLPRLFAEEGIGYDTLRHLAQLSMESPTEIKIENDKKEIKTVNLLRPTEKYLNLF
jgi:hypothetical protein